MTSESTGRIRDRPDRPGLYWWRAGEDCHWRPVYVWKDVFSGEIRSSNWGGQWLGPLPTDGPMPIPDELLARPVPEAVEAAVLKPCPFCGGTDIDTDWSCSGAFATCKTCDAFGPEAE